MARRIVAQHVPQIKGIEAKGCEENCLGDLDVIGETKVREDIQQEKRKDKASLYQCKSFKILNFFIRQFLACQVSD